MADIDFSKVKGLKLPEGTVIKITADGAIIWSESEGGEETPEDPSEEEHYKVGLLADVHIQYDSDQDGNGHLDFEDACEWYKELGVEAICIAGDLTRNGYESDLNEWRTKRDLYRGDIPVYSSSGNHESKQSTSLQVTNPNAMLPYLDSDATSGGDPFYIKVIGDDIYAFMPVYVGNVQGSSNTFNTTTLSWLESLLEAHKNQRVFLFMHMLPNPTLTGNFGSANGLYSVYPMGTSKADTKSFLNMMDKYKNVIWFSGHSHIKWEYETEYPGLNYTRYNGDGAKLIHLSSTTVPRDIIDGARTDIYAEGQAAYMKVYADRIELFGRDVAKGEDIEEFHMVIDTTPVIIDEDAPTPEVTLSSITATKTNKTYNIGDVVATNDIVVTAHYSDGSYASVSGWTSSSVNTASAGTKTMTITYQGKTTTIQIVVNEAIVPDPEPETPSHEDVNMPFTWNAGKLDYNTGAITSDANYRYSSNIPHTSGATYTLKTTKHFGGGYPRIGVAEYDSNNNVIGYTADVIDGTATNLTGNFTPGNPNTTSIVLRMTAKSGMAELVVDGVITVVKHT